MLHELLLALVGCTGDVFMDVKEQAVALGLNTPKKTRPGVTNDNDGETDSDASETIADECTFRQVEFLHGANLILVIRNGSIVQSGQFDELLAAGLDFESLVEAHNESLDKVATSNESPVEETKIELAHSTNSDSGNSRLDRHSSSRNWRSLSGNAKGPMPLERSVSVANGSATDIVQDVNSLKLIEEEERSSGQVSLGVYRLYLTAAYGGALALMVLVIQFVWQGLSLAGDNWVAYETGTNEEHFDPQRFTLVYGVLAALCALADCVAFVDEPHDFPRLLLEDASVSLLTSPFSRIPREKYWTGFFTYASTIRSWTISVGDVGT